MFAWRNVMTGERYGSGVASSGLICAESGEHPSLLEIPAFEWL
jgi:hypothetical protein